MSVFKVGDRVVLRDNVYYNLSSSGEHFASGATGEVRGLAHKGQIILVHLDDAEAPEPFDGSGEWAFVISEVEVLS